MHRSGSHSRKQVSRVVPWVFVLRGRIPALRPVTNVNIRHEPMVAATRHSAIGSSANYLESIRYAGGGRGIRTPERVTPLTVFKTAGFNHSPIPPIPILLDFIRLRTRSLLGLALVPKARRASIDNMPTLALAIPLAFAVLPTDLQKHVHDRKIEGWRTRGIGTFLPPGHLHGAATCRPWSTSAPG